MSVRGIVKATTPPFVGSYLGLIISQAILLAAPACSTRYHDQDRIDMVQISDQAFQAIKYAAR